MRSLPIIAGAFLLAVGAAAPSFASDKARCGSAPRETWLTEDAVKAKVGEQGYEVRRIKADKSCFEVKATDKAGAKVELHVDPVTGNVMPPEASRKRGS